MGSIQRHGYHAANGFGLRRLLPDWVSRALGIAGHVSFADAEKLVGTLGPHRDAVRKMSADSIRLHAQDYRDQGSLDPCRDLGLIALAAEAAHRALGQEPHDEQLVAVVAMVQGRAVEMDTGEGKTLVGALTAAILAIAGRRVHVLSINDYLARRDAEWMAPLFMLLGVEHASVVQGDELVQRRNAYRAEVVYVSVSELGYDVLRDRQVMAPADRVLPTFDCAVVDEVDAVMVDEAMTPLILAGTSYDLPDEAPLADRLVQALRDGIDYVVDKGSSTVSLTDSGIDALESRLGGINLYTIEHSDTLARVGLALQAHALLRKDIDYLVSDGEIRLINPVRGRIAEQQRWPDGLHAAVEAKEGLPVSLPGVILDSVTVQDLLSSYEQITGMSGTVLAVAEELAEFYQLEAGRVPRHRPLIRVDLPLRVYESSDAKMVDIVQEVVSRHHAGQPVLVGTQSVAQSEELKVQLKPYLDARVLNARNDVEEADIVSRAGEYGAVTISTQMSGRGTDIRLGGSDERDRDRVVCVGGLAVLATAIYPSQRLDAQLRGRAGRQGDPGVSQAFSSLDDEVVRENLTPTDAEKVTLAAGKLSESTLVRMIVRAQQISESARLNRHRDTWQYNRAIAAQRTKVLVYREELLHGRWPGASLEHLVTVAARTDLAALGMATVRRAASLIAIHVLDERWQGHLALLDEIREGIHLRVLGGQSPVEEFHRIALREFHTFFESVEEEAIAALMSLDAEGMRNPVSALELRRPSATWTYMVDHEGLGTAGGRAAATIRRAFRTAARH